MAMASTTLVTLALGSPSQISVELFVWAYVRHDTSAEASGWLTPLQAIGGAVWHGVKGFRNSPYGERRIGGSTYYAISLYMHIILIHPFHSDHSDKGSRACTRR